MSEYDVGRLVAAHGRTLFYFTYYYPKIRPYRTRFIHPFDANQSQTKTTHIHDDLCTLFDNKGKKQFDFKKAKLLLEDDNVSAIQRPHTIRFIELVCEGRKNFKEHKDKFDKRKKKQVNQLTVRNVERKIRCDKGRKKLTRYTKFYFYFLPVTTNKFKMGAEIGNICLEIIELFNFIVLQFWSHLKIHRRSHDHHAP